MRDKLSLCPSCALAQEPRDYRAPPTLSPPERNWLHSHYVFMSEVRLHCGYYNAYVAVRDVKRNWTRTIKLYSLRPTTVWLDRAFVSQLRIAKQSCVPVHNHASYHEDLWGLWGMFTPCLYGPLWALTSFKTCTFFYMICLQETGVAQSVQGRAMGLTAGVRFPAGARHFSILHSVQTGSGAHPPSYPMGANHLHLVPRSVMVELYFQSLHTSSWHSA
jgi:hypothetical protein